MYPSYNTPYYMMDKQPPQYPPQQTTQQPTPNINQTFQLAPNQPNNNVRYAESLDDVRRELVFGDTIFVNREYNRMWLKNARGETKEYELIEIVEVDPKDAEIKKLEAQVEELKKVIEYATNNPRFTDEQPTTKKPTTSKSSKNNDE